MFSYFKLKQIFTPIFFSIVLKYSEAPDKVMWIQNPMETPLLYRGLLFYIFNTLSKKEKNSVIAMGFLPNGTSFFQSRALLTSRKGYVSRVPVTFI